MPVTDGIAISSTDPLNPTVAYSGAAYGKVSLTNDAASGGTVHWVINGVDTGSQTPPGGVSPISGTLIGGITSIAGYCASGKSATIYITFMQ